MFKRLSFVVCDECEENYIGGQNQAEARKEASRLGWNLTQFGEFCPDCGEPEHESREEPSPKYCKACGAAPGEDCNTASTLEVPRDCINRETP